MIRLLVVIAVLLAVPAPPVWGKSWLAEHPSAPEAVIIEALARPISLSVSDVPLAKLVDYLARTHEINIQIDREALIDIGMDDTAPVSIHVSNVSLRTVLQLALDPLELDWTIYDEVLLVTSQQAAEEYLVTKLYDVSDLVVDPKDGAADYEALAGVLTSCVEPTSWDAAGGPGGMSGYDTPRAHCLIVTQTWRIHDEVAGLLAALRQIGGKPVATNPAGRLRAVSPVRAPKKYLVPAAPAWAVPVVHAPAETPARR